MEKLKVLITVKTYPIPSKKYDELVCTAGVREDGSFVRLYPINFRELSDEQKYRKYQWIEVMAKRHEGRDSRKESYRPDSKTLRNLGEPIGTDGGAWSTRARFALAQKSQSIEALRDQQKQDRTSLGIFKPKAIHDVIVTPDDPEWPPAFQAALMQARLWDERTASKVPPRKVPYRFQYRFECDDDRCKNGHKMSILDWELGALYWRLVDDGADPEEAARKVRQKYLDELCGPDRDTHFYVGTILNHPNSWVVIGVWYAKLIPKSPQLRLALGMT